MDNFVRPLRYFRPSVFSEVHKHIFVYEIRVSDGLDRQDCRLVGCKTVQYNINSPTFRKKVLSECYLLPCRRAALTAVLTVLRNSKVRTEGFDTKQGASLLNAQCKIFI
jgi:hypothetical protein